MRALVVGLGRMGSLHYKVLSDLGYDVSTVDPAVRADYASVGEAMMERHLGWERGEEITVAVVAVPISELVLTAFQLAGIPKLLVEKPFAPTVKDALMLGAYLASCGSDVAVGYVERFNPQVRAFRKTIRDGLGIQTARFIRHNARLSNDHELDLLTHDVDLASYLRLWGADPTFDVKSNNGEHVRRIEVDVVRKRSGDGSVELAETIVADLMDHDLSPLHAMWHAFLTDGDGLARPRDAVRALERARLVMQNREPKDPTLETISA